MADAADCATECAAFESLADLRIPTKTFKPVGRCYNCDSPVEGNRIYCDGECAEDHEWFMKRSSK